MKEIVDELIRRNITIATMESCTGGKLANEITNIAGASNIFKFGAVTYSNEYKIKMGVSKDVIDKYSVYSMQTAHEMAYNIHKYACSDIGVGITGKLCRIDENNDIGDNDKVYVSIYYQDNYYDLDIRVSNKPRTENKDDIIKEIEKKLSDILWKEK